MNQLNIYNESLELVEGQQYFSNRAFLYGESLFSTIRISQHKALFLTKHRDRLNESLQFMYQDQLPDNFNENILQLCKYYPEAKIRATLYKESSYEGLLGKEKKVQILYYLKSIDQKFLNQISEVSLCYGESKKAETLLPSFLKNGSYLLASLEKQNAVKRGYHDVIFLNQTNHLTEATTSNILFKKDDRYYSPKPSSMVLGGITRSIIIDSLRSKNIEVCENPISIEEVIKMQQCWLLSSIIGLQKVIKLEESVFFNHGDDTELLKDILLEN
jgi:4-amino-4-deoxychorismate lyase